MTYLTICLQSTVLLAAVNSLLTATVNFGNGGFSRQIPPFLPLDAINIFDDASGVGNGDVSLASSTSPFSSLDAINNRDVASDLRRPFQFSPVSSPAFQGVTSNFGRPSQFSPVPSQGGFQRVPSRNRSEFLPDAVNLFASSFSKATASSPTLTDLFTLPTDNPMEAARVYFRRIYKELTDGKSPTPIELSNLVAQAVELNIAHTTPSSLSFIYGYTAGMPLYKRGTLTLENASDLSAKFAAAAENVIKKSAPNDLKSKVNSLTDSFLDFFTSFGPVDPKYYVDLKVYFVEAWYFFSKS